jgi:probable HAF family extracellular repeat protein
MTGLRVAGSIAMLAATAANAASIEGIGVPRIGLQASRANAVTPDASVVVGVSGDPESIVFSLFEALHWPEWRLEGLGDLAGGSVQSQALDVSDDGRVIVGIGRGENGADRAVRWLDGVLDTLPASGVLQPNAAYGVSADGGVIVGQSVGSMGSQPVRWVDGQIEGLGNFPDATFAFGAAFAVSPDGATVVGWTSGRGTVEAFRWKDGELESLGFLPQDCCVEQARGLALSPDGATVVGDSLSFGGYEAFRWKDGTMVGLGDLPGGALGSTAWGVTADGAVVVGTGTTAEGRRAFWWDAEHGMRALSDVLAADHGVDVGGWTLLEARAITPDGCTVVGQGRGPRSRPEAFVASLCEIEARIHLAKHRLNLSSKSGSVRVSLFGSAELDVAAVDAGSLRFGPAHAGPLGRPSRAADFDGDGFLDSRFRFSIPDSGFVIGDPEGCLRGRTLEGVAFRGCEPVTLREKTRDR